jgi:hypothetical protein
LSSAEAFAIIHARSGTMYDPALIAPFVDVVQTTHGTGEDAGQTADAAARAPSGGTFGGTMSSGAPLDEAQLGIRLGLALSSVAVLFDPPAALVHALTQLPDVDAAVVFHAGEGADRLAPLAAGGADARTLERLSIPVGERLSGWVAAADQPMINADAALDLFDANVRQFRSVVAAPCILGDGRKIVASLYSFRDSPFSEFHPRLIRAAAESLGQGSAPKARAYALHESNRRPDSPGSPAPKR